MNCSGYNLTTLDISQCPTLVSYVVGGNVYYDGSNTTYRFPEQSSKYLLYPSTATLIAGSITVPASPKIPIDEAHFPDPAFRQYISDNFDVDKDGTLNRGEREHNGYVSFTLGEWDTAKHKYVGLGITSLQGIEYFPNLNGLSCPGNPITSLDLSIFKNLRVIPRN